MASQRYIKYLQSEGWKIKRGGALTAAAYRCQVCNSSKRLDVHHRTYSRLGDEYPEDLTVLCRECHTLFHEKRVLQKTEKLQQPKHWKTAKLFIEHIEMKAAQEGRKPLNRVSRELVKSKNWPPDPVNITSQQSLHELFSIGKDRKWRSCIGAAWGTVIQRIRREKKATNV